MITFMFFFPHALYACNLLIYNNNVHIYTAAECTSREYKSCDPVENYYTVCSCVVAYNNNMTTTTTRRLWSAARKIIFFSPTHISLVESGKTHSLGPPATDVRPCLRRHGCTISTYLHLQIYCRMLYFRLRELSTLCFLYANFPSRVYTVTILLTARCVNITR
ncbi:unnamed protein product [Aphis gossypii]|uniref:Uncharacterized protein n=1 Tax=Aphis gossypii TaxID=80765 RepID=A0A9P0IT03_APHGO|nr:unnamed protein product [Aphis gossypii]